jgi:hypothetical protein
VLKSTILTFKPMAEQRVSTQAVVCGWSLSETRNTFLLLDLIRKVLIVY